MPDHIPEDAYRKIEALIASDARPARIHAKKTLVLILHQFNAI